MPEIHHVLKTGDPHERIARIRWVRRLNAGHVRRNSCPPRRWRIARRLANRAAASLSPRQEHRLYPAFCYCLYHINYRISISGTYSNSPVSSKVIIPLKHSMQAVPPVDIVSSLHLLYSSVALIL